MLSTSLFRILFSLAIILHGLGHLLGILPVLGFRLSANHSADSWLLSGILGKTATGVCIGICLICTILLIGSGMAMNRWLVDIQHWRPLLISGAFLSLIGLCIFWNAFPFLVPNKIGIIAVDLFCLYLLFIQNWQPTA